MQTIHISGIGEVELRKSKRAKRLILKINQEGRPVVTVPYFAPYRVAEKFLLEHTSWLQQNLKTQQPTLLEPGKAIGRDHTLLFKVSLTTISKPRSTVSKNAVLVTHAATQSFDDEVVQKEAKKAAIRALRRQAEKYLPPLLHSLAKKHGYSYREVRIKSAFTRWGSCSSNRIINLSIWLMQLPDPLIEYVICHELTHLNHMNHSRRFWEELEGMAPGSKHLKKQLQQYRPAIM